MIIEFENEEEALEFLRDVPLHWSDFIKYCKENNFIKNKNPLEEWEEYAIKISDDMKDYEIGSFSKETTKNIISKACNAINYLKEQIK